MNKYLDTRLDGRYLVEELIGEGGMADVYRGKDLKEDRVVAIKILRDEFYENEELVRRFKNESRAISVLNHDKIIKVYDVSVDNRVHYIVMEYVDGITLKEYIEQRGEPLTYKETVHFTTQILNALQHAHDKGIIHRDIKPQNIMIDESGSIKVMDFGIARLARSEDHTVSDQAIGSVHYISPEQAKGEPTDQRADIYSVGIMMYEMLTGTLPFESDDVVAIAIQQISDEAPPVLEVNPAAPEGLSEITKKAMAKEPRFRYKDAMDMLRDIEAFKRNPSIKFEYEYITDDEPSRYIDKMMNSTKTSSAQSGRRPAGGSRRRKKVGLLLPITIGLTIAVVGACALLCWNLLMYSGNPLFTKFNDIELPNFVGMQYEDVKKELKKEEFKYLRVEEPKEEYNLKKPVGEVLSQNPTQKKVKANQRLYLTVNMGAKDINVPDVTSMSRNEAVEEILRSGLRPYVKKEQSDTVQLGRVIRTNPEAGQTVTMLPDTIIEIYVSGAVSVDEYPVPSVIGSTSEQDASNRLRASNMELGSVSKVENEAPAGTVIEQDPAAATLRRKGTAVNITVSLGPPAPVEPPAEAVPTTIVPDVTGQSQGSAASVLASAGYTSNVGGTMHHDSIPEGNVISTSPPAGTPLLAGFNVSMYVSRGPKPTEAAKPVEPEENKADNNNEAGAVDASKLTTSIQDTIAFLNKRDWWN